MNKELEEYYNAYFELFNTKGWKQLTEELTTNVSVINSVEATKDESDMYFRKGQLNVLAFVLNLETAIQNAYEEANSETDFNSDD